MKRLIFILLTVILNTGIYAQTIGKPALNYRKIYPGTITNQDGSVVQGYILNMDNVQNQNEVTFFKDYNDSKSKSVFHPGDILGYSVENNQYKSVAYAGTLKLGKAGKHFSFIGKPGAITTFIYWGPDEQIFWQKANEEPVISSSMLLGFNKNIQKLVGDYPELMTKINAKAKGYTLVNIDKIIDEYNEWATSKK